MIYRCYHNIELDYKLTPVDHYEARSGEKYIEIRSAKFPWNDLDVEIENFTRKEIAPFGKWLMEHDLIDKVSSDFKLMVFMCHKTVGLELPSIPPIVLKIFARVAISLKFSIFSTTSLDSPDEAPQEKGYGIEN